MICFHSPKRKAAFTETMTTMNTIRTRRFIWIVVCIRTSSPCGISLHVARQQGTTLKTSQATEAMPTYVEKTQHNPCAAPAERKRTVHGPRPLKEALRPH